MGASDVAAGARRRGLSIPTTRRGLRFGGLLLAYLVGALLVGFALLSDWSTQAPRAHRGPWLYLLSSGIAIGSLALFGLDRSARDWLKSDEDTDPKTWPGRTLQRLRGWRRLLTAGLIAYLLGAAALILLGVKQGSGWIALTGAWLAGAALTVMTASLQHRIGAIDSDRPWWVRLATLGGLFVLMGALAVGLRGSQQDWVLVLAGLVGLLALSTVSLGLLVLCKEGPAVWCAFGLGVIIASGISVVALWALDASIAFFVPPVVLGVLGFVPLSRGVPQRIKQDKLGWATWAVFAYALVAAGLGAILTMTLASRDWLPVSAVAVFILTAILATALVSETSQLVVVLLLGAALAFVVDVGPGPVELGADSVAGPRLVAFGDSYISGEGATQYFSGTNVVGGDECRRAPTAYPQLLAKKLDKSLDFYACSGATTDDVAVAEGGAPTQLQQFLDDETSRSENGIEARPIEFVLVSVGGNDAWFGTVGQACLGPGSCDVHRDTLFANVADIVKRIETVHTQIREAVGESVPVVAMPYPLILTEAGCDSSMLFASEHQFLFEFTDVLNSAVELAAKRAGVNFFSPGITAFDPVVDPDTGRLTRHGHRICDEDQEGALVDDQDVGLAVNLIDIQPKEGALADRMLPTNWMHGSVHPNEIGHRLMADALADWLDTIDGNPVPEPWAERGQPPPGQRVVPTRLLGIPNAVLVPNELRVPSELPVTATVEVLMAGVPYPLANARVGSFIHHSQPTDEWLRVGPVPADGSATVPTWDEEQLDCTAEVAPRQQIILWQERDEGWQVAIRDYCGGASSEVATSSISMPAELNELPVPGTDELPVSAAAEYSELGAEASLGAVRVGSFVYSNQPNGEWLSIGPIAEESASSVPGWGRETQIDFDAEAMAPRQVIIWRDRYTGNWDIVVRHYCELDPECPDSEDEIKAWTISQIGSSIRQGTLPVVLLFIGFWALAIHIAIGQHYRAGWRQRLFPWLIPQGEAKHTANTLSTGG